MAKKAKGGKKKAAKKKGGHHHWSLKRSSTGGIRPRGGKVGGLGPRTSEAALPGMLAGDDIPPDDE